MRGLAHAWPLALVACVGCALFSKGERIEPRYFTVDTGGSQAAHAASVDTARSAERRLRLGRVQAAAELRERVVYRKGNELGFYEEVRWAEPPETYLRRALEHELFYERRFVRAISGQAPTLRAELRAFEQVRDGQLPRVRVAITFVLDDERSALVERTLQREQALDRAGADRAAATARAMAAALRQVVDEVGALVADALPEQGAVRATPPQ